MSGEGTGWQDDGSYVPCPECEWAPPIERNPPPGRRLGGQTGTYHDGDCPTVPHLSPEAQRELQAALDEISRCRRRAMASARNYVIG